MRILRVRYEDGVLKPLGEHCLEESQEFNIAVPEPDDLENQRRAMKSIPEPTWGKQRDGRDLIEKIYEARRLGTQVPQDP